MQNLAKEDVIIVRVDIRLQHTLVNCLIDNDNNNNYNYTPIEIPDKYKVSDYAAVALRFRGIRADLQIRLYKIFKEIQDMVGKLQQSFTTVLQDRIQEVHATGSFVNDGLQ